MSATREDVKQVPATVQEEVSSEFGSIYEFKATSSFGSTSDSNSQFWQNIAELTKENEGENIPEFKKRKQDTKAEMPPQKKQRTSTSTVLKVFTPRALLTKNPPIAVKKKIVSKNPLDPIATTVDSSDNITGFPQDNFAIGQVTPIVDINPAALPYFKKIGELATTILSFSTAHEENIYAISYVIILIGELINKLVTNYPKDIDAKSNLHTWSKMSGDLRQVFDTLKKVRNFLADSFVHHAEYQVVFNLILDDTTENDWYRLNLVVSGNTPLKNPVFYDFKKMLDMFSKAENESVSYKDRFSYILYALNKIIAIKSHGKDDEISKFAISMLYIIAGTVARTLIARKALITNDLNQDNEISSVLTCLVNIRNDFAHTNCAVSAFKDPFKDATYSIENDKNYLDTLIKSKATINKIIEDCGSPAYDGQPKPLVKFIAHHADLKEQKSEVEATKFLRK